MRRSKKFILIGLLAAVVLVGTLGGIAIAQADDENTNQLETQEANLMEKIATIYEKNTGTAIDATQLQAAFNEAREEIITETRDNFLQNLVDEGKITQEQADQYKAWLESKPDFSIRMGPFNSGRFGHGGFFRGFHRMCEPDTTN